ncbi:MAG: ATP-binding protein [Candidatus Micrarchaeota archaeon]|nr:ATP-binding protein [Candidatus Micrarchaeota archaeon]
MVIKPSIVSSSEISKLAHMHYSDEPFPSLTQNSLIYIGNTRSDSSPFFLDPSCLINPHIFVFGMSGSGKSYLIKSMMVRMSVFASSRVLLIDFTGEYREFVEHLFYKETEIESLDDALETGGICYFNLMRLGEQQKQLSAKRILERVLEGARIRGPRTDYNLFVVLDEAWKLLLNHDTLGVLIREGRKYGIGLILASQLLGDISEAFLSNVATIFAFRIQDGQSIGALSRSYELDSEKANAIQNLDVGSCLVLQIYKGQSKGSFFIDRVKGVQLARSFSLKSGDKMRIEIEDARFTRFLKGLSLSESQISVVKSFFAGDYSVELSRLISELISLGADRREILRGLRGIGFGEDEIADAFADAVS